MLKNGNKRKITIMALAGFILAVSIAAAFFINGYIIENCWKRFNKEADSAGRLLEAYVESYAVQISRSTSQAADEALKTGANWKWEVTEEVSKLKESTASNETRVVFEGDMDFEGLLSEISESHTGFAARLDFSPGQSPSIIVYAKCFKEGQVVGVVISKIDAESIERGVTLGALDGKMCVSLVSKSNPEKSINIEKNVNALDGGSVYATGGTSFETWIDRIKKGSVARFEYGMSNRDSDRIAIAIPSNISEAMLVADVDSETAFENAKLFRSIFAVVIAGELIIIAVGLLWVYLDIRKELAVEKKKSREQLERVTPFASYFINTFYLAYYVNLEEDRVVVCKSAALRNMEDMSINAFLRLVENYISEYVKPEDAEKIERIADAEVMKEYLGSKETMSIVYTESINGVERSCKLQLIRGMDEKHVVVGITDITDALETERQVQAVIKGLSEDFLAVSYINPETGKDTVFRFDENFSAVFPRWYEITNFDERIKYICDYEVHPDDRENFLANSKIGVILKNLNKKPVYYVNYRALFDGRTEYRQIKFMLTNTDPIQLVAGYLNTDEFTRGQIEAKNRLEKALKKADIFQKAAYVTACAYFIADLTEDRIIGDLTEIVNGEEVHCKGIYPDSVMTSYSALIDFCGAHAIRSNREQYNRTMNREYLINCAKEGEMQQEVTCWVDTPLNQYRCRRYVVYLSVDEISGHIMYTCIAYDVSQKKLEEEDYIKRINKLMKLTDDLEIVYDVDLKTNGYVAYSRYNFLISNMSSKTTGGKNFFDEITAAFANEVIEEDKETVTGFINRDNIEKQLRTKSEISCDYRIKNPEGPKWFHVKVTGYEEKNEKHIIVGLFNVDERYTEQKKQQLALEQALALAKSANVAKTSFLSNMSHDIRTPMNAIVGYTGLAVNNVENSEKVRDYLKKIENSSNHLLSLINDVLDMSRIESGKMILSEKKENLKEIILAAEEIIHTLLSEKNIEYTVDVSQIKNEEVLCDKLRLNQIFLNILSNAVKYTQNYGKVSLIAAEGKDIRSGYGRYEIRIKDNGMGMDEEFLKNIFDPFTRVNNTTVSGIQGTGLGMAITKNIVDMMGGTINILSKPGEGTEVILEFDFKRTQGRAEMAIEEKQDEPIRDLKGKRVLLVEDNEMNREIGTDILEGEGILVESADDGMIAVQMIKTSKPGYYDLVLMDIQMPVMNGYDATRAIRKLEDKELASIPIVAMTANAFEEDRKAAFEAGMNEHMTKPISPKKVIETLNRFIR